MYRYILSRILPVPGFDLTGRDLLTTHFFAFSLRLLKHLSLISTLLIWFMYNLRLSLSALLGWDLRISSFNSATFF